MGAEPREERCARGLFLVTSEDDPGRIAGASAPHATRLHLPAPDPEANAAALLTALYPGRALLAGRGDLPARTFLDLLARQEFALYASVPPDLAFLLPEGARPFEPSAPRRHPCCVWLHARGEIPRDALEAAHRAAQDSPVAFVPLAPAPSAAEWEEERYRVCMRCSRPFPAGDAALIDFFPSIGSWLQVPLHQGDGANLAWEPAALDRAFFGEDWRRGVVRVTRNGATLVCGLGRRRAPPGVGALMRFLGAWRTPAYRTIWDARALVETAARARLTPLRRIGVPQRAEALQLLGLLEAHLARYARATDREVMGRLKDLGYL